MSGDVQPQGGNKLQLISLNSVWSFRKGSKRQFISYKNRGLKWHCWFFFWHRFLNNLSFCQPFHMTSESCHGLTIPYSNTSPSSSPSSRICWVSLMISFKVHLILLAATTLVCSQTQTERPRTHTFSSVAAEFGTPWSGRGIYRQVIGMGTTQDETYVTFSEDHVLQGTDLFRCQALLHPDVLYQKC